MYDDRLELELFEDTTWHVPAVMGLAVGGLGAWWLMSRRMGAFQGLGQGTYQRKARRIPAGKRRYNERYWQTYMPCVKSGGSKKECHEFAERFYQRRRYGT